MTIVVTRHPALIEYLLEQGIVREGEYKLLSHVDDVREIQGQDIVGTLPLRLAAQCKSLTEVTMRIPEELRGCELSKEQLSQFTTGISTYVVFEA